MIQGNWIPLSKAALDLIEPGRRYTPLEALFCLQCDYDHSRPVTVSGYASLWGWSRDAVRSFLVIVGLEIAYPEDTTIKQKQRGMLSLKQIKKQKTDSKETENRQNLFIDNKQLQDLATENPQKPDSKKTDEAATTKETMYRDIVSLPHRLSDSDTETGAETEKKPETEPETEKSRKLPKPSLKDTHLQGITPDHLKAWSEKFNRIDIEREIGKAQVWLVENPKKAAKLKDVERFLCNWFSRANDDAPARLEDGAPVILPATQRPKTAEEILREQLGYE